MPLRNFVFPFSLWLSTNQIKSDFFQMKIEIYNIYTHKHQKSVIHMEY